MLNNILKWQATIAINFSRITAYRLDFLLTILGPTLTIFFIKYHLWTAIYASNAGEIINGYDLQKMIDYHLWAMIIHLVAQGYHGNNLALEIRHGKISTYLIYPFSFWEFHSASFISFQFIQLLIATLTCTILSSIGVLSMPSLPFLCLGILTCLLISLLWFLIQFFIGVLSFWLDETWMLRVLVQVIVSFLSGYIIPLDLFPPWLTTILNYTPFPFMTFYPVKAFLNQEIPWTQSFMLLCFWIIVAILSTILIWKKGVRNYTGAGM